MCGHMSVKYNIIHYILTEKHTFYCEIMNWSLLRRNGGTGTNDRGSALQNRARFSNILLVFFFCCIIVCWLYKLTLSDQAQVCNWGPVFLI